MSSESDNGQGQLVRRALIIDKNKDFSQFLKCAARAVRMEVAVVGTGKEGLASISRQPPDIVFLSVEHPKKTGFSLFTRIKRVARQVPIIVSSSTVPMDDLLLHQKLRLHADAYLDKHDLEEVELLKTLNRVLELGLDAGEIAEAALAAMRIEKDVSPPAELTPESINDEIVAAIDALGTSIDKTAAETGSSSASAATSHLEDELKSVRSELEAARHAAGSSPFSAEYLMLREKADQSDRRIAGLNADMQKLTSDLVDSETQHAELKQKLAAAQDDERSAVERAADLERRFGELQNELTKARGRTGELEQELARHGDVVEQLKQDTETRIKQLEQQHAGKITALENKHGAALRAVKTELDETTTKHAETIAKLTRQHESKLSAVRAELKEQERTAIGREVKRLTEAHRKELNDERRSGAAAIEKHAQALTRRDADHRQALELVATEYQRDLSRAVSNHRSQLECAERKRRSDLDQAEVRHRAELGVAEEKWRSELDGAEARHREQLDAASERYRARIEQLEQDRRAADAATQTHAAKAAQACGDLLRAKQETQHYQDKLGKEIAELRQQRAADLERTERKQAAETGQHNKPEAEDTFGELLDSVRECDLMIDFEPPAADTHGD